MHSGGLNNIVDRAVRTPADTILSNLKTGVAERSPWVRIPPHPPASPECQRCPTKSIKLSCLWAFRAGRVDRRGAERQLCSRIARILSIAPFGGGLRRFPSGAEIRRHLLQSEKQTERGVSGGGAIRLDRRIRATFPGLANSAEDRHGRWTETAR